MAVTGDDPLRKLSEDKGTVTVSIPKADLRADGVLDEDDDLDGATYAKVEREAEREYSVEVLDL
ncbi:hypothetical protein [Halorarius halobius]|uniref:hypothetical protein n=1 Tax=Halorarius halobius TaxID=2962671 RepID=UPI0020CFCA90|nr:hypothetical protein [Halorarius halobius]